MDHVTFDELGICEHCNKIILIQDYAGSEGGENWHCKHCSKEIGHASFGYDVPGIGCKKVRWVGPQGKWVTERPEETFRLPNLIVTNGTFY